MTKTKLDKFMKKKVKEKNLKMYKIPTLSINMLEKGMYVYGCVRQIYPRYVTVILPGGISAVLPNTSVSPVYTQALELAKQKITDDVCPPLSKLFQIGEPLCCRINSIEESGEFNPTVTLSISPDDINKGRSHSNMKIGDFLTVAIEQRDESGYVVFTGIDGLAASLKDSEAVKNTEERSSNMALARGQVINCIVTKAVGKESSTEAELTADPDVVSSSVLKSNITIEKLRPMARVTVTVQNVWSNGLEVKIRHCSEDILGYIESSHLESCWSELDHYVPDTKLKATVLCVIKPKRIVFLSLKEKLNRILEQKLKGGTISDKAKISAVATEGIYITIGKKEDEVKGFIHLRHIDGNVDPAEVPLKYPVGTKLQTRVITFDPVQRIYNCSLESAFINEKYVTISDVNVGDIVECRLKEVLENGDTLFTLGRLTLFAPVEHMSGAQLMEFKTNPSIGKQVTARIWCVDEISDNVFVTLKPALLKSELLMSYEQAHKGEQYYGVITSITKDGLNISFGKDVFGFLPRMFMGYEANVMQDFMQGQLVKCYIVDTDYKSKKLLLGFNEKKTQIERIIPVDEETPIGWFRGINNKALKVETSESSRLSRMDTVIKKGVDLFTTHLAQWCEQQDYKTGTRLTGKVVSATQDGILVLFENSVKGILPSSLYTDCIPGEDIEALVLWQNLSNKLLYLQPVGTFLEEQKVKSRKNIIGSRLSGRVLFTKSGMAICVVLGTGENPLEKHLVYIPTFDNAVLSVGSKCSLIVQAISENFIICLVRTSVKQKYKDHSLKIPEHVLHARRMKNKGQLDKQAVQPYTEETKLNNNSKVNKQKKRKSEESFTEYSVEHQKNKDDFIVPGEEEMHVVSVGNKKKKMKGEKKKAVEDVDMIVDNIENVQEEIDTGSVTGKKKKRKKKMELADNVETVEQEINSSNVEYKEKKKKKGKKEVKDVNYVSGHDLETPGKKKQKKANKILRNGKTNNRLESGKNSES